MGRSRLPKQILLPCELPDQVPLTRMLSEQVGRRVELVTPQRGAKMDLIRLANQNAAGGGGTGHHPGGAAEQAAGGCWAGCWAWTEPPRRMESYDISNTGASDIVASMVVYVDGRPLKRDYRRFKLKDMTRPRTTTPPWSRCCTRRFRRYLDGDEKFMPTARPASHRRRREPRAGGRAGAGGHGAGHSRLRHGEGRPPPHPGPGRRRTGREIGIQAMPAVFSLIGQIQEETHRFAIEYHRQLQAGHVQSLRSGQDPRGGGEAPGRSCSSTSKASRPSEQASLEELERAVPKNTAQAVYQYFRRGRQRIRSRLRKGRVTHASDLRLCPGQTAQGAPGDGHPSHHRQGEGVPVQYHPV